MSDTRKEMNLFPDLQNSPPIEKEPEFVAQPPADTSPVLLATDETLSPMEAWRKRHKIMVYKTMEGFRACTQLRKAHGATVEEALLAWAEKSHVRCWKSEQLTKSEA